MKNLVIQICTLSLAIFLLLSLCSCAGGKESDNGEAYYISCNGVRICPGEEAGDLLEKLGEPDFAADYGNCGGQGVQKMYSYDSFEVYLLETADGKITVDQISLCDDLMETPRGICIGDDREEVIEQYGEPTESTISTMIYQKGAQELVFKLDETDTVIGIDIIHVTR